MDNGEDMTAEEYLTTHWIKNKIYTHNRASHHVKRFAYCAKVLTGSKFIDIGCACGHSTAALKKLRGGDWSGLDFFESVIETARKDFPGITFYYSPDNNYKELVGEYDSVVCSEVIEHVPDDRVFVDKVIGIAKEVVIFTTPHKNVGDPGHVRVYSAKALQELFDGYDYSIERDETFFYILVKK